MKSSHQSLLARSIVSLGLILTLLGLPQVWVQAGGKTGESAPAVETHRASVMEQLISPVVFEGSLRDLPPASGNAPARLTPQLDASPLAAQESDAPPGPDPALQAQPPQVMMPAPALSFDGLAFDAWGAGWPPDANGEVGTNHFIQAVNTSFGVFSKNGALLAAATFDAFFDGTATPCDDDNQGAPVVLFDHLANRWLVSDYAWSDIDNGPYYQCVAVSRSDDPVNGGWYLYAFPAHSAYLHDYPKLAVWPDGYYMSANLFDVSGGGTSGAYMGVRIWALNRDDLLSGSPLHIVYGDLGTSYYSLLPSNLEGPPPPYGTPNFFASLYDGTTDRLYIWKFQVNWSNPPDSVIAGPTSTVLTSFNSVLDCGASGRDCIPQYNGSRLEAMAGRLMMQAQYRNFGAYQSLWLNHTVDANTSLDIAGIRWYEVRNPGGTPTIAQTGTWADTATLMERWMGSLAVDHMGNMALGYSASNANSYASIRYAGRLVSDPSGVLGQGEALLQAGSGAQTSYNRWGGYSAMSLDPTDDCTFWYVNEYYAVTGDRWQTRIGAFRYPSCNAVKYWDGSSNNRWDLASNWTPDGVPTARDDVIIDATYAPRRWPTLNVNAEVHDLTIGNGAQLNVTDNYNLTVYGNWQQNGSGIFNAANGTVLLRGANQTLNMSTPAANNHFYHLQIGNSTSAPVVRLSSNLRVDGNFTAALGAVFQAGSYALEVSGNLDFQGHFDPGASTLRFGTTTARLARQMQLSPILSHNFELWPLPPGWSVVNNIGACGWRDRTDVTTSTDTNNTGGAGNYADADSDDCGAGTTVDSELRTPVLDLSQTPAAYLQFKSDMRWYSNGQWDVDLSLDGGNTWPINLLHRQGQDYRGPETITLDLAPAVGQSNARLRFHYRGNYDYWWQVDEVRVYGFTGPLTLYNLQLAAGVTTLGSDVIVRNNLSIENGATLNLNAYHLDIGGDFANGGIYTRNSSFTHDNDITLFNGANAQHITGGSLTTFNHLTIANPAGVILQQDQAVNGVLTLSQGWLTLGSHTLTLGAAASIAGSPSRTSMIVADGGGQLRKVFTSPGSFTFPVGDNTGDAEYSPVTLDFTSGSFTNAYVAVRLSDDKHPANSSTTHYLSRWWQVTQAGISNFSCDAQFTYTPADVVGVESNIVGAKFDGSSWMVLNPVDAANHRFSATVTSFSDFSGGDPRPLAVTLSDWRATPFNGAVLLQWTTALEVDTIGFDIYRSDSPDGERTRINAALIPPQGLGGVGGAMYTFVDNSARPGGVYYYWLEAISISGREAFGPAVVQTYFVTFLPAVVH